MKIKKYIPDFITSMNLLCGAIGVVFAAHHHIETAFLFMIGGAVFDFFDGFTARLLGAYSHLGKELDSLADDITFGLLPALMLFQAAPGHGYWKWAFLLIAVFSGIRLAKFNVDTRQTNSFIGMPTPACAMICGSLACYLFAYHNSRLYAVLTEYPFCQAIFAIILCYLLICEFPMFSMKMHKSDGMNRDMILRMIFAVAAVAALAFVLIAHKYWSLVILMAFGAYVVINLANAIFRKQQE